MRSRTDVRSGATRRAFVCMGLAAGVGALGGCSDAKPAPRAVRLGRETCQNCGMTVSDARYAALIWDSEYGRVRVYDDFGCAVVAAFQRKELDRADVAFWVADETDPAKWLDARAARFRDNAATPMGYGHAAGPEANHPLDYEKAVTAICDKAMCAREPRARS